MMQDEAKVAWESNGVFYGNPPFPTDVIRDKIHAFSRELLISLLRNFTVCETPHVLSTFNPILSKLLHIDLNHWRVGWRAHALHANGANHDNQPVSRSSAIFVALWKSVSYQLSRSNSFVIRTQEDTFAPLLMIKFLSPISTGAAIRHGGEWRGTCEC